jgi:hypothetical protein
VEVEGHRGLVRTKDLGALESATLPRDDDGIRLLGPFDPLTVGAGLREHLIPAKHLSRVSRTAGWISPVVLVDGRAAAVWDSKRAGDRVTITIESFGRAGPAHRRAFAAAAERVASAHGARAIVAYGRVFGGKQAPPEG